MEPDEDSPIQVPDIAVLVPCYNEEQTVGEVVREFQENLPSAEIYVFDNNSTDNTVQVAREAGATVKSESRQGKGNVVRTMFREVEADFYLMVDGDCTYPAAAAEKMLAPVKEGKADMVVGDRLSSAAYDKENKRRFHGFGNRLVRWLINKLFAADLNDIMSGYRAFNRTFVKTIPILSRGFEIETEMTLHALDKKFRIEEVPIEYQDRPPGSTSKLNTLLDGFRVLKTVFTVFKNYHPLKFFGWLAFFTFLVGFGLGILPVYEFIVYQYVYRVPTAVLAASLEILAFLFFCSGLILSTMVDYHRRQYELQLNNYAADRDE